MNACRRCEGELPEGRTTWCSDTCKRAVKRARYKANGKRGKTQAYRRAKRRATHPHPWDHFVRAVGPRKAYTESEKHQRAARELVAAGAVAYENRRGFIRDVGQPRAPEDAGRVFGFAHQRETAAV